jgi:hypothetical protein
MAKAGSPTKLKVTFTAQRKQVSGLPGRLQSPFETSAQVRSGPGISLDTNFQLPPLRKYKEYDKVTDPPQLERIQVQVSRSLCEVPPVWGLPYQRRSLPWNLE